MSEDVLQEQTALFGPWGMKWAMVFNNPSCNFQFSGKEWSSLLHSNDVMMNGIQVCIVVVIVAMITDIFTSLDSVVIVVLFSHCQWLIVAVCC